MRISDWSSDVCSSDLQLPRADRIYLVPVGDLLRLHDLRRDRLAMDDRGSGADHRWLRRRRPPQTPGLGRCRSEEHTYELQSLMRISYAVFCLKKKKSTLIYYPSTI